MKAHVSGASAGWVANRQETDAMRSSNRSTAPVSTSRHAYAHAALTTVLLLLFTGCGGGNGAGGGTNNPGTPQVQVGQNLNGQAADNTVTCSQGAPGQTTVFAGFFLPSPAGTTSCTLITFFDGAQVPAKGTVVSANIKVGPVTGPMRFVRARVLFTRQLPQDVTTCCSVQEIGPTFTPQPNAITTVPLNFAMTHEAIQPALAIGTTIAQDMVALEVLAPNVPIPGTWMNPPFGPNFQQANYIYWPAFTLNPANAGQNKRSNTGFSGFMPSYNLNFISTGVSGRIVEP
jgi:hypothetical protein